MTSRNSTRPDGGHEAGTSPFSLTNAAARSGLSPDSICAYSEMRWKELSLTSSSFMLRTSVRIVWLSPMALVREKPTRPADPDL